MPKSIFTTLTFPGQPIDLLKTMQIMFDQASLQNKILWEKTYVDRWFTSNLPQYGLTCEGILGKYKLRFLASIIGNNAATPLRPSDGFDTWKGEIPRVGHKFLMTADKMRKLQEIYESPRLQDAQKFAEIKKTMISDFQEAYLGTKDAVDHIILRALSNGGVADFTSAINPDGRIYKVDYEMPAENKLQAAIAWTDANLLTLDCMLELGKASYDFAEKGVVFGEALMSPEIKYFMKRSGLIKTAILGTDKGKGVITDAAFDEYWAQNGLPPITLITKKNAGQVDGERTTIDPWNHDMIVLKPAGTIGELQPAFEDSAIIPEENVNYTDAGSGIRMAKWTVGESSGQAAGEYTQGSWRVVPIINSINAVVNLRVRNLV